MRFATKAVWTETAARVRVATAGAGPIDKQALSRLQVSCRR